MVVAGPVVIPASLVEIVAGFKVDVPTASSRRTDEISGATMEIQMRPISRVGVAANDSIGASDGRFVAVLGMPPVNSAHRAVQVWIVADAKKGK